MLHQSNIKAASQPICPCLDFPEGIRPHCTVLPELKRNPIKLWFNGLLKVPSLSAVKREAGPLTIPGEEAALREAPALPTKTLCFYLQLLAFSYVDCR